MFDTHMDELPLHGVSGRQRCCRGVIVELLLPDKEQEWDDYVRHHPEGTVYHLCGWRQVVRLAYGHEAHYLTARAAGRLAGILPLICLKHFLLGTRLVSIPFFDRGGILADGPQVAETLIDHAVELGRQLGAEVIELRHLRPQVGIRLEPDGEPLVRSIQTHKVGMELGLPRSAEDLWNSFRAKLRSQIRKPLKEGLTVKIGGMELLAPFYQVLVRNMRDLGSPVHTRKMPEAVLQVFAHKTAIIMIFDRSKPVAGGLVIGSGSVLANPWASALRQYRASSPNMLLYWAMLTFACRHGYEIFDFGRSTPGGGTYRFKNQWGAEARPLSWERIHLQAKTGNTAPDSRRLQAAVRCWQKMPVSWSRVLGPLIRKHIDL